MKPTRIGRWILLACLFGFGCQNANSQLRLNVMETGAHSGMPAAGASFIVVSDSQAFAELYNRTHALKMPKPDVPPIDFKNQLVLAAFMGEKSTAGYGISFDESASSTGDTLLVKVKFQSPPQDAILPQVMTSPYAMATVDRGNLKQIKFIDTDGNTLAVKKVE